MQKLVLILSILAIAGCVSNLNRVARIEAESLHIGKSSKTDVVNQIGLPNKVKTVNGSEYWYYSGRPDHVDMTTVVPIAGSASVVSTSENMNFKPILVCVFDQKDKLSAVFKPKTNGEMPRE